MGSSSSSSQLKQQYDTTTTTNVGDIGVTGSQVVGIVNSNTDIAKTAINANARNTDLFTGALTDAYGQSLAFAKDITSKAFSNISSGTNAALSTGADLVQSSAGNLTGTAAKYGTYIVIAIIAFFALKGKT